MNFLPKSIVLIITILFFLGINQTSGQSLLLVNNFKFLSNISKDHNLRSDILNFADQYIGTRYVSGGSTPKGFDCSGFVRFVFEQYGYELAHSSRELSNTGEAVSRKDAQPGDLVIFAYRGRVHHVGIVLSNNDGNIDMIHCSTSQGVVIENINSDSYWNRRFYSVRRVL